MQPVRLSTSLLLSALALTACGGESKTPAKTPADQIAQTSGPVEHFESARGKFSMDFPALWKGNYHAVERADTAGGARMTVEFVFTGEPAWKAKEQTLFVVRVFTQAAWGKLATKPGAPMAEKVAELGDAVYALSFAPSNPYKKDSPESARFDQMMIAVVNGPPAVRLDPRP